MYAVPFNTIKSGILLPDMFTTLSLNMKLDVSLQIFDLYLSTDLYNLFPNNLVRLLILTVCQEI